MRVAINGDGSGIVSNRVIMAEHEAEVTGHAGKGRRAEGVKKGGMARKRTCMQVGF